MKRLLSFFVILFTSAVLWAQNNVITYTAAAKLTTTTDSWTSGLHNAFNVSISSHTFSNGVGTIIFSGTVATIGSWAFYGCSGLTSITIPSSVTSIGYDAFSGCSGLTSITIPSSVTSIGDAAFSGCSGLTSITIPSSVTSIGDAAFSGCSGLTSITIPSSVTSIGYSAFSGCSGLTSITIPEGVTSIGEAAFYGCSGLTFITIPSSVTRIGSSAFENCSGLTSITIPEGVTYIEKTAFRYCSGLTSITIPSSVTSISSYAFAFCSGLTSITIPNSVTSIGSSAFSDCSGLTSITIPSSVTSIGKSAFYNCSGLTAVNYTGTIADWCRISFYVYSSNPIYYAHHLFINNIEVKDLVIPESVTSIGNSAFYNCSGLTSITIPSSVTSIGNSAFQDCSGLTAVNYTGTIADWCRISFNGFSSNPIYYAHHLFINNIEVKDLVIPNGVTSIGGDAFLYCSGLTSITIPSSVTSIGDAAFYGCSGLTYFTIENDDIVIPYTKQMLPSDVFIFVPSTLLSAYKSAEGWSYRANLILATDTQTEYTLSTTAQSNNSDIATQIGLANLSNVVKLSVSGTVNSYDIKIIREKMSNLRELDLSGASIVDCSYTYYDSDHTEANKISGYMFCQLSSLKSIQLPNNVTSIGNFAFYSCYGLTSITIPSSVTSIENYAFDGCSSLTSITSLAKTPPSLSIYSFSGVDKTIPLMVPCGNIGDYYWAYGWSEFTNIVEDECNKVVLTIQSNNTTLGSVSAGDEYTIGTTVEISATANYGFRFSAWSDGNTDNPRMVGLISDTTFTAVFDTASFAVSKQHTPVAGGLIEGPDSVLYMHEGTYTAIANEGYLFEAWSDGTTANPRTITVMGDTTIQALFIRYEKVIVHDTTYIDRVDTIEMVTATSMDPITGEARLLVQAVPADGYEFFCWSDFNTDNPRVVDVSDGEPKVYTAVFRAKVNTAMREESAPTTYTQTYDILGRKVDSGHHGLKVSAQGKTIGK